MDRIGSAKRRRWITWVLILVVVVALIGWLLYWIDTGGGAFEDALAEARAMGGPVTIHEMLEARREWDDNDNGALVMESLCERLSTVLEGEEIDALPIVGSAKLPPLGERWSAELCRTVDSQLQHLSDELASIDSLAGYEGGRFYLNPAPNPYETVPPHLRPLRQAAKLKWLQTVHRATQGRFSTVADDIDVLLRHGKLVEDEPFLICLLVRMACDALAVQTIEQVLAQGELERQQLKRIEQQFADIEYTRGLALALRGERAVLIGAAEWVLAGGDVAELSALKFVRLPLIRGWHKRNFAVAVQMYNRLVAAADDPHRVVEVARQVKSEIEDLPWYYAETKDVAPSLARATQMPLKLAAHIRSARTALAMERYRIDVGRFTVRLEDLVPDYMPDVLADPFDGEPLRCRMTDDRLVIYGVGEDMIDDGGHVWENIEEGQGKPKDIGFVLLSPAMRGRAAQDRTSSAPAEERRNSP